MSCFFIIGWRYREKMKNFFIGKTFTLTKQNTNTLISYKRAVGGSVRCEYLSSIRFSSINENWKSKSISVHLDWFHLKQNVKKKNQNWNKHFWSFHLRKIAVKRLFFLFLTIFFRNTKWKANLLIRFSFFSSKPNLEITAIT